jgi:DNA-binding MarR family transcriptional regulator
MSTEVMAEGISAAYESRPTRTYGDKMTARKNFNEGEELILRDFLSALEPFREIRQTMPLQYVVSFLLVAVDEGRGVTEYAERAGVSQSVMSRHLLDLGDRNRHKEPGFGLVTYKPSMENLSKHEYYLTPKGKGVAHRILRELAKVAKRGIG